MATSGPGWEGIDIAWTEMVRARNAAQERELHATLEEAEAAALADEDPPTP